MTAASAQRRLRLLLLGALLSCVPAARAGDAPPPITALVAFGDSLSDEGNLPLATRHHPQPTGPRHTWVGMLADKLGVADFGPSGLVAPARGTNYAFAGAMTAWSVANGLGFGPPFDQNHLGIQIAGRYLDPSFNPAGPRRDPAALHTLSIGGNDLIAAANHPDQIASGWATLDTQARRIAADLETQIAALARAGVRRLLWVNLADLSATPYARQMAERHGPRSGLYLEKLGHAVLACNREIDAALLRLRGDPAHAGLVITLLDLHAGFRRIQADPAAHGFINVRDNLATLPLVGLGGGAPEGRAEDYLFIDEIHPSPKAHGLIADAALQALAATP